ncbi:MAG TPA: T3SS effector HopA1 family protein [Blastocatellia bacterium]|nr:T3SS effector HopA1 family protein [Blastocatellia bacterium]
MANQVVSEIRKILKAVTVMSPTSFSFAGRVIDQSILPAHIAIPVETDNPLVRLLANYLYFYCFCHKFNGDLPDDRPGAPPDNDFIELLSEANASRERWDTGWQIVQILPSGQVTAQKNGVSRSFWAGEFITLDGPGMPLRVGATIRVFSPKESRTLQPGFYMVFSEAMIDDANDYNLVRFYWNIEAEGAPELTRQVTRSLNRFLLPFRFKCLTTPDSYTRLDSAVLYVSKRYYRITTELLADVHRNVRQRLLPDTPIFARRLARGLGLAEDPGDKDSFGTHRSRILAEGIVRAHDHGATTEQARLQEVVKQFHSYGIDIERPYLNPGSQNVYTFPNTQA